MMGFNSCNKNSAAAFSNSRIYPLFFCCGCLTHPLAFLREHHRDVFFGLQETRANVDVEFVLHLLRLAGSLLPELISEEVLAKMCRKNAKATVRHTVRDSVAFTPPLDDCLL